MDRRSTATNVERSDELSTRECPLLGSGLELFGKKKTLNFQPFRIRSPRPSDVSEKKGLRIKLITLAIFQLLTQYQLMNKVDL